MRRFQTFPPAPGPGRLPPKSGHMAGGVKTRIFISGRYQQMIKDQFDTLYREGAENGRVMCLSLHPHNIGRLNAAKHLDEALRYILGHDGVWATTADDIAEYYLANYYGQVKSRIAQRNAQTAS